MPVIGFNPVIVIAPGSLPAPARYPAPPAIFANGEGLGLWQNAAAIDRSGGSAMVYLSMSAPIALDLTKITQGGVIRATWTDPRNGDQVDGGLYRKAIQTLVPPDGFEDALLLLEGVAPQGGRRPF